MRLPTRNFRSIALVADGVATGLDGRGHTLFIIQPQGNGHHRSQRSRWTCLARGLLAAVFALTTWRRMVSATGTNRVPLLTFKYAVWRPCRERRSCGIAKVSFTNKPWHACGWQPEEACSQKRPRRSMPPGCQHLACQMYPGPRNSCGQLQILRPQPRIGTSTSFASRRS